MDKKIKNVLLKKRQSEAYIARLEDFMLRYDENQVDELSTCLEQLDSHHNSFINAIGKLEELDDKEDTIEACINDRCDMDERYRKLRGFFLKHKPMENHTVNNSLLLSSTAALNSSSTVNIRLPKVELPTFDGDDTKWLTFRDRFVAMIDSSPEIPPIMKLQYLLGTLKGDAARPFEHTSLTADNYAVTWKMLLKRYDNKRMLCREYYRRLHFLPSVDGTNVDDLASLVDEFTRNVNGLRKLDQPVDSWDVPLINILFLKLDSESLWAWERHSSTSPQDKYSELISFLQDRVRILRSTLNLERSKELVAITVAGVKHKSSAVVKGTTSSPSHRRSQSYAVTTGREKTVAVKPTSCSLGCSDRHPLRTCPAFDRKSVKDRRDIVAKLRLCFNCLSMDHQVPECNSKYSCRFCNARHHTLLHITSPAPTTTPFGQPNFPAKISMSAQSDEVQEGDMVLLETAIITIVDDHGQQIKARALLDSGSTSNFITESLAKRLQTPQKRVNIVITGIGQAVQQVKNSIVATIESQNQEFSTKMEFFILRAPTSDIPSAPIDVSSWQVPDVTLADPNYHTPSQIDVVIGGEAFWELHTGRKRALGPGKPWLMETPFGWVVAGNATHKKTPSNKTALLSAAIVSEPLEAMIQRFWELETVDDGPAFSVQENYCEEYYTSTVNREPSGRYVVRLPRNVTNGATLGASREIADRRLLSVERRLRSNPEMAKAYSAFMEAYENLGHMKKLPEPVDDTIEHCYIPHHAVVKDSSTTTKVRVVFDASCKTSSGYSLNDTLLVGPIVQEDLFSIILRFRTHAIAIAADIEKMYRQILHHPEDRSLLRIRYRKSTTDPISTYELATVTYGTASAPFLATRTLQQIARDHQQSFPDAVDPVLHDFYVDDLLSGASNIADVVKKVTQITAMLNSAGMVLRKWVSNCPEALEGIPAENIAIQSVHELEDHSVSTLGLVWEPRNDAFRFQVDLPPPPMSLTKRQALSFIAKIFDPLGLLGPTIIISKMFMQRLWTLKRNGTALDWDSTLPPQLQEEWNQYHQGIFRLREVRVPRFVSLVQARSVQLHMFADASQSAYGTCGYIRAETKEYVSVQLITAKSKVVSLTNTHSIARLELCAARLATQLYKKIINATRFNIKVYFWTDSTTVLYWLQSLPSRWKPFVANRVAQIQRDTDGMSWKHVPGRDNPADDISRGVKAEDLINRHRWWNGPHWLAQNESNWPTFIPSNDEGELADEERKAAQPITCTTIARAFSNTLFARYSSYHKLRRVVAYIFKYVRCLRTKAYSSQHPKGCRAENKRDVADTDIVQATITTEDLHQAEIALCKLAQQDTFDDEIHALTTGRQVSRASRLKWLRPYLDETGVLRVGGRLGNMTASHSVKHPIVLTAAHPMAVLLATAYHLRLLHAGPQLLLATLRQRFWVIGGRSLVKSIYHRCLQCFKAKPTLVQQSVADLPESRVTPTRAFSVCGVDYCGPLFIKSNVRNRGPSKAYIAIFVCFSTRAVHIELVSDLTTTAFLSALRRFVARRGMVKELHSDNATTFKGAANELHRIYKMLKQNEEDRKSIFNWCAENGMIWRFIPPRAPHFGGLWEAAVKSAKHHLLRTIGTTSITYENMLTLLTQIESCLNSRPLVPMSEDPCDLEVLTPGHFLIGGNMQSVPDIDHTNIASNRLNEYQLVQRYVRSIWQRWQREYTQQLQARSSFGSRSVVELKENQLVLIREDNAHPTEWPKGRIVKLHPGKDDVIRVVTLRTAPDKYIVRPTARLALLPTTSPE